MLTGLFEPIKGKGAQIIEQQVRSHAVNENIAVHMWYVHVVDLLSILTMLILQYIIQRTSIVHNTLSNTLIKQSHGWFG